MERIVQTGPGFTVTEPNPAHDRFARWRPVLNRLSPQDREDLMMGIIMKRGQRAKDALVAEYAARIQGEYVDAVAEVRESPAPRGSAA